MFAVIMAGGSGTRFWPLSRKKSPKQFSSITGNSSLLYETIQRIRDYFPYEKILIVGREDHRDLIYKEASMLPKENILLEPVGKNTAPCIAFAAMWIAERNPCEKMLILPSDHIIKPKEKLLEDIKAIDYFLNDNDALIALGIKPASPHTGYGYIELSTASVSSPFYSVQSFTEKPDVETAQKFIHNGNYLWNAGMFAWNVRTILTAFEEHLPHIYEVIHELAPYLTKKDYSRELKKAYSAFETISIDYGIMEKVRNVMAYKCDFTWNDVGSFDSIYRLLDKDTSGNIFENDHYNFDSKGMYIKSKKFVATIGIEDVIVIDTDDALLLCKRDRSEEIKKIMDYLNKEKKTSLI